MSKQETNPEVKLGPAQKGSRYFEDIEIGERHTIEQARTITEADVVNFAGISADFSPNHMSKTSNRESDTEYDRRLAHGNLVFSILHGMISERNEKSLASYGYDHVRFTAPVHIGETLTFHREVVEKEDYDDRYGKVTKKLSAENEDGEIVCVANHIALIEKGSYAE